MKPTDGPLLYEVRCASLDSGKRHGHLLAQVTRAAGQLSWHFEPGAWASATEGQAPTVYVRCGRHGVGAVPALAVQPRPAARSKPRVVDVRCG